MLGQIYLDLLFPFGKRVSYTDDLFFNMFEIGMIAVSNVSQFLYKGDKLFNIFHHVNVLSGMDSFFFFMIKTVH